MNESGSSECDECGSLKNKFSFSNFKPREKYYNTRMCTLICVIFDLIGKLWSPIIKDLRNF